MQQINLYTVCKFSGFSTGDKISLTVATLFLQAQLYKIENIFFIN